MATVSSPSLTVTSPCPPYSVTFHRFFPSKRAPAPSFATSGFGADASFGTAPSFEGAQHVAQHDRHVGHEEEQSEHLGHGLDEHPAARSARAASVRNLSRIICSGA